MDFFSVVLVVVGVFAFVWARILLRFFWWDFVVVIVLGVCLFAGLWFWGGVF